MCVTSHVFTWNQLSKSILWKINIRARVFKSFRIWRTTPLDTYKMKRSMHHLQFKFIPSNSFLRWLCSGNKVDWNGFSVALSCFTSLRHNASDVGQHALFGRYLDHVNTSSQPYTTSVFVPLRLFVLSIWSQCLKFVTGFDVLSLRASDYSSGIYT